MEEPSINKRIIENIDNYTMEFIDNNLILTPKIHMIYEKDIDNIEFAYSKIVKCKVHNNSNIISEKLADIFKNEMKVFK